MFQELDLRCNFSPKDVAKKDLSNKCIPINLIAFLIKDGCRIELKPNNISNRFKR